MKGLSAFTLTTFAAGVPAGVGLNAFLAPLRHPAGGEGRWVRVSTLDAVPADGIPRRFAIVADQVNVWTKTPSAPVGAVFLRRTGEKEFKAFQVTCPHAGCVVDYSTAHGSFLCPCHNSTFGLDGRVNDPKSPSPRGLDELALEIRNNREIWVRFQNFRTGVHERIPT